MDKKIRVAVVGMGGMGKCHSGNLFQLPEVELAALCSTHPDDTKVFMAEKGMTCPVYTDYYKMIEEVALDAVYICLPPYGHNGQVEAAAEKGLHIFIEKPIALTLERGKSMADAVAKAGVHSQVGYHMRFGAAVRRLKELMDAGQTGKPGMYIASYECNSLHNHWWIQKDKCGGQVFEQVIHLYDMAQYLMGDAAGVSGHTSNLMHGDVPGYTVEDASIANISFASGALGSITGSNCGVPDRWVGRFRVIFQNLVADFDDHNHGRIIYTDHRKGTVEEISQDDDVMMLETRYFIDTILGKAKPFSTMAEGYSDLKLVSSVLTSSDNGGTVIKL